ncbi:NAD(P)-dependent oxidoreductase [Pseudonocardia sp. TRM90224]|uniref:NAD(P)-dependent oxidoreductase n=1 Tax=Pseudonocardia sp. TRM90224 TaxID=2812678 RepID=UPI001E4445C2|nr:NAD(P)-binding domain-containing protein [Pseudonocardia sp. TRM90224]
MTKTETNRVSLLGLGAMGHALAAAVVAAGHDTTVWNRSEGKAGDLVKQGAVEASSVGAAVRAADVVVVCLFDHESVHEVLDPHAADLAGRVVVNLTTTSPDQSRELTTWAAAAGIRYLDGGIMAVPHMIGKPGSSIFYSGDTAVFEQHRALLDLWGASIFYGEDAGLASLYDIALLAGMYVMWAGFIHGAAMVAPSGMSARDFAKLAAPWQSAMTASFAGLAEVIDSGDYTLKGDDQSLEFSDLTKMVEASRAQGMDPVAVEMVQELMRRQIDAGFGKESVARIYESVRAR